MYNYNNKMGFVRFKLGISEANYVKNWTTVSFAVFEILN